MSAISVRDLVVNRGGTDVLKGISFTVEPGSVYALLGGNVVSDEERFKDCQRLTFACVACQREVVLDAPFVGSVSHARHLVSLCIVCQLCQYVMC